MNWIDAVREAIDEVCNRKMTDVFTRDELIRQQLASIVKATGSQGRTPENTLSRILQDLRDLGEVEFVNDRGVYRRK